MNKAPIEYRHASVTGIDIKERMAELIAVPYDEEAKVEYRGEIWDESFAPGSFEGLDTRPDHLRPTANRDHDATRLVGVAEKTYPNRAEGLLSEVRIAEGPLGDDTLGLLKIGALKASVGFGVLGSWQELNKPKRRINKAYLDHIAFVAAPAYAGARVLSVRTDDDWREAADLPPLNTPNLDEVLDWMKQRQSLRTSA